MSKKTTKAAEAAKEKMLLELKLAAKPFKGVDFHITSGKYRARLTNNGVSHSLGYYTNPIEGAKAYNKKAKSLFRSEKNAKAKGYWNVINN